jgi:hypothetical protein
MDSASATLDLLIDLESRHDELLMRLDELDKRVQNVLTDWQAPQRRLIPLLPLQVARLADRPPEPELQGDADHFVE